VLAGTHAVLAHTGSPAGVHTWAHAFVHTRAHAFVHTRAHAFVHTRAHAVHTRAHAVLVHVASSLSQRLDQLLALIRVQGLMQSIERVLHGGLTRGCCCGERANVRIRLCVIDFARRHAVGHIVHELLPGLLRSIARLLQIGLDRFDRSLLLGFELQ
jgi:hypothetical protein